MKFIERFSRKPVSQPPMAEAAAAPLLMALEPRIMFDASVGVVAQDATAQTAAEAAKDSTPTDNAGAAPSTPSAAPGSQRQEVVFIDGNVSNIEQLLTGLSGKPEVVILDPEKDGLLQMADYLKGREGLDAIHLLSHGAEGAVQMGNVWLNSGNLAGHASELQSIGAALKADGDLLLYGCKVGEDGKGEAFVENLAAITGADVAASTDDTGAATLGGNWSLERASGAIETVALGSELGGYESLLAVSYTTGSGPTLPTNALARYVVGDFNNDGISDILFQPGTNGTTWQIALGSSSGAFSYYAASDATNSPFSNVTLIDASGNGSNYYAADFDKDGDTDLLAVTTNNGPAYLYRYDSASGKYTREVAGGLTDATLGVRLVVGDFNGDGAADILYTPASANVWRYAQNNGDGTFTTMDQSASPFAGVSLVAITTYNYRAVDFDGDGDIDVLAFTNTTTGFLYRNNGTSFSQASTAGLPTVPLAARTVVGDFDGDGDADILYQVGDNGAWKYSSQNADGTFTTVDLINSPFGVSSLPNMGFQNVRIGDFDGDGDIDVIGSVGASSAMVYFQGGSLPRLVSATPADNSLNVQPGANITLTFSQSVTPGSGTISIIRLSDGAVVQTIQAGSASVTGSGTTWTIDPPSDLDQGTAYAIRIDSKAFVNADGKTFKGITNNSALNFTTASVQPPVIGNLNGDAVTYIEDSPYVLLDAGGNATVSDADSSNFNGGKLTVQVTTGRVDGQDVLFIRDQVAGANQVVLSGASIMYNGLVIGTFTGGSNGNPLVVTFTSNANATTVAALVQNLAYRNSNGSDPSTTQRTVSISMDDGAGGSSSVSTVVVDVVAVNDAPLVNVTGTNPTYTENTPAVQLFSGATINTVEPGQKVAQMTFTVSNVANGAAEKLVIDGSDVTLVNGTSVVTNNNGLVVTISVISGTASVTLSSSAGLDTATAQTILNTMAYRNDSESPNTANRVVTLSTVSDDGGSANGGVPTAAVGVFSTVTVVGVNDAPVLVGGPYSLPAINEDTVSNGLRVSTLLANYTLIDPDVGALRGIAVYATAGNGTWQFSTDNATWTNFGTVASSSALLLASTTYVRYVPDGANGETASFGFRGWDQTTGAASVNGVRGTADTTSNGGTTAFSTGTGVANQPVSSLNDAPVMTPVSPTLGGLTDTSVDNGGSTVLALLGGVTDVDAAPAQGMAITDLTATYGKWQYSLDAGSTWSDVGAVTTSSALILTAQNRVRFVPDGIHGETATITYKAWDQTSDAGLQGTKVNVSVSGGASAYSTGTDVASVVVTAVNDAPVLTVTGTPAAWTEGNNVPSTPIVVDGALTVSDADGPNPNQATARLLTYYSAQDTLSFVNDGVSMGNIVGSWSVGTGILTLTSAGNQATTAQFQAALRAVTYSNASETPNTTTRTVEFILTDGGNVSSAAVTRDITITAVDDAPVISAAASQQISEDTPTALSQISFSDVDSTLGIVTLSVASGGLSAADADGVTVGGTATAMTLSGSLANINQFIANNRLVFTPAANASGDVTLTINVNTNSVADATTSMTLQVVAVNDAPVVTVPASITVTEDVPGYVTGISFSDVDAGNGNVTATFSVVRGTLTAAATSGVMVGGAGTGVLTLTGTLADLNALLASNNLSYRTAQDDTQSVTLTVTLNDNGNTGGPALSDSKALTINVDAVNDAPVNSIPSLQTAQQGVPLAFNTANGNAISISDVDAGSDPMLVTLSAVNGTISLSSLNGVTLLNGTGVNDTWVRLLGNQTNLNAALQSLTFKANDGYLGAASLIIQTNDLGKSGAGSALTDTDTVQINVIPVNPKVTSVSASGFDRTVKAGDEVLIEVAFDQVVNADTSGGVPSLLLETGLIDREAVYISGSGSSILVFKYTVQAGDTSADLDFHSTAALQLNGAVLANASNDLAVLTLPSVGSADSLGGRSNIVVDGVVPVVASVQAPFDGTYILGQNLDFTVNFSENVTVDSTTGVPRIAITLDTGGTAYAEYVSGSGGSALVFRLTVTSGQLDSTGVTLGSTVQLNGGSIRDVAGNDTVVTLNSVASTANVNVDGIVPTVVSVAPPLAGSYKAGDVLSFTVNASEAVQTGALAPRLVLDVGGVTRYATYVSGSGSAALVFHYTVQAGDTAANGITLATLDLRGEPLTDLAGNDLNLALNGVGDTAGVLIDTTAPTVGSIVRVDASPSNSSSVSYTVTFDENVSGVDLSDFVLVSSGTASGSISSVTAVDGRTYTVLVNGLNGIGGLRLDLKNSGTGIVDGAGNAVVGGLSGDTYIIDRVAPSVVSVAVPGNGTYVAGQSLDFTVQLDEAALLDTSGGTPRIAVTLDDGTVAYATYLSGAGTSALVFRMTVANGQLDTNGVTLGGSIQLNGATLRDAVGNDVNLALNNVASTTGVLVDAVAPVIESVTVPGAGSYKVGDVLAFTVNASEALLLGPMAPRLALDVGGITRYATYVSGNGSAALVFEYVVQAGDTDANGIALAGLDLRGETLTDFAGNDLNMVLNGVGSTAGVLIDTTVPTATNISRVDTSPSNSGSVSFTVAFSERVGNVDASDFELVFSGSAFGSIGSITTVDGLTYTVNVSGLVGTGSVRLDLKPGTDIADAAGNRVAAGLAGEGYSIDRDVPSVTGVSVPANGRYTAGQHLDFTVSLSEAVQVDTGNGTARIAVTLDDGTVAYATYLSGAGTNALVFRLTVANGQLDTNGVTLGGSIQLNGATLRDAVGNDVNLALNNVASTTGVLVDAVAPVIESVTVPGAGSYKAGDVLAFTVNASEALLLGPMAPRLALDVGGITRYATYVSGNGSAALVFEYVVQAGDTDANGIALAGLDLRGETLTDFAGNDLNMVLNGVGSTAGVLIDTTAPAATNISRVDASPSNSGSVSFTVAFSERVGNVDASDFELVFSGSAFGSIGSITTVDGLTYTVNVSGLVGTGSVRLDLKPGTDIADAAGNRVAAGLAGEGYSIDRDVPSVTGVSVPANGRYTAGQHLDFTVSLSEAVQVDTGNGTARIAVTLDDGTVAYATYLSGAGTDALVFRLTVANAQLDTNGVTLGGSIQLNGATLRDAVGNDVNLALNNVASTTGVLVDAVAPVIESVTVPGAGSYKVGDVLAFTVNASEALLLGPMGPRLALDVGGITRYATYVSGNGSAALVFEYVVQAGDTDANGIELAGLDLRGETLTDLAGNALDLALNGAGSTAGVVIDTTAPSVGSIVRIDANPNNSGSVSYTVSFDEDVKGVDVSDFSLFLTGSAAGSISSVTAVDGRTYTVVVTGLSGSGSLRLDLNSSGTGIADAAGNAVVGGLSGATYTIDRVAPSVASVQVPGNGTYVAGQNLDFTVQLDEAAQLDTSNGTPRIAVTLDDGTVAYATYLSGAGTNALVFRMIVAKGQLDTNGVALGNSIQLNGATLRDAAGNDVNLTLNNVASTAGVQVDAVVPVVESVAVPAGGSYKAGDVLGFTVNTSEGVVVDTSTGTPRLALTVGGVTRYATYVSGAASGALVFQYTVQAGDTASGGIAVSGSLDLNGGSIKDAAGNALNLNLGAVGNTSNVLIDTSAPTATNITRVDASPNNSGSVSFTVTFSENVGNVDASDFSLAFGGSASGSIESVTTTDGRTYSVKVSGLVGTGSVRLDLKAGTDIVDAAGNRVVAGRVGDSYSIDRDVPSVTRVGVPANGSYVAGQNLDFTVSLSEAVQLDTGNGTPRIAVTLDDGTVAYATYLSGAGTNALVFRMIVANGQLDTNGVALGNSIQLNGATLRDAAGNDVNLTLNNVASTAGVQVDAVVPVVESVAVPAGGSYKAGDVLGFTVNTSEGVVVDTSTGTPRLALTVGGVTRYATYVSGAASGALVFQYTVQAGDTASGGIAVSGSLDLNGGSIKDAAGNALNLNLGAVGNTSNVLIDTSAPTATNITRVDASPNNSGSVSFTVTFSENVGNVDASDFSLAFGGSASGSIESVTTTDGRTYSVKVSGLVGTGSVRLDLKAGTDIVDAAGNRVVAGRVGDSYSIDRDVPSVTRVGVPANGSYVAGQNLDFTVSLSEAVQLDTGNGTPRIAVTLDDGTVAYATYLSGAGTNALVFRMIVANGQLDTNGVALGNSIQLNGATLRDAAGNDVNLTLNNVASTAGVQVDAVVPVVESVAVPAGGSYKAGDVLGFTVNTSEGVVVDTSTGTPRLALTVGGVTRYATYVSGAASGALVFQYTVQAGDTASGGIAVSGSLDLNGGSIKDAAGNALNLNLGAVGNTSNVLIDTSAPTATNITRVDASPNNSGSVSFTVTFSENVGNVDASDFSLAFGGSASGSIESVTTTDGRTYSVKVSGLVGTGSVRLDLKAGTDIVDAAGNRVVAGRVGDSYSIDRDVPSVTRVGVPANGSYVAGQNLDFTVSLSEAVQLDTGNGTPRIAVTLDDGTVAYATYLSGAGTNALVFRMIVANGQLDTNGVALGNSIQLNGATLRDAAGNDVNLTLNNVASTAGVQVDAVVPVVESVAVPAGGSYKAGDVLGFTVNTSEGVVVDTSTGTPRLALTVGGVTRYATYVSGAANGALVFQYTVQAGDTASGGIAVSGSLDLNGGSIKDAAGNALNLNLGAVGNTGNVLIDTSAPTATNITRVDITPTNASSLRYTVTFDESVTGVDSADFALALTGSASGRIASVTRIDGRTYLVVVDNLSGAGTVRLDLSASNTGITDGVGNPINGGLQGSTYSLDRVAPLVTSVSVPAPGAYTAGNTLDFTVNTDEAVLVDNGNGNPRLAITLDNGRVVYADYLSGSGTTALTFRLTVTSGMAGNSTFAVAPQIDTNGGSLSDERGNQANTGLNNVGDTRGILVDAKAPRPIGIVLDGPVQPTDTTLSFTLTFDEAVSGVDADDFSVLGTGSASGVVQSVQQVDGRTYRILVGGLRGQGALALSLNALNSGIQDASGNALAVSLVGQAQSLQAQEVGDLEYRLNPPQLVVETQQAVVQPQVISPVQNSGVSPLLPGSLFDVRSVGGDLQPLGTIFLGNAASAPSFIAQVFGSSDSSLSGQGGLSGFANAGSSVFGSSTLSAIFSHQVPGVSEMNVFNGSQWRPAEISQGLRGVFGAPSLTQQLQQLDEAEQRHVRELAQALAQPAQIGKQA